MDKQETRCGRFMSISRGAGGKCVGRWWIGCWMGGTGRLTLMPRSRKAGTCAATDRAKFRTSGHPSRRSTKTSVVVSFQRLSEVHRSCDGYGPEVARREEGSGRGEGWFSLGKHPVRRKQHMQNNGPGGDAASSRPGVMSTYQRHRCHRQRVLWRAVCWRA